MNEIFIESKLSEAAPYLNPDAIIYKDDMFMNELDNRRESMVQLAQRLGHCNDNCWFMSPKLGFFIGN